MWRFLGSAVLDTCAVWSCLRLKAPASPQARRLLRAYVATQRTLAPAGTKEKKHSHRPFGESVNGLFSTLALSLY